MNYKNLEMPQNVLPIRINSSYQQGIHPQKAMLTNLDLLPIDCRNIPVDHILLRT